MKLDESNTFPDIERTGPNDMDYIFTQGNDAIFLPRHLVKKFLSIADLSLDSIPFTVDIEYLQILNTEEGLTIFDGHEAVFCENIRIQELIDVIF